MTGKDSGGIDGMSSGATEGRVSGRVIGKAGKSTDLESGIFISGRVAIGAMAAMKED